MLSLSRYLKQVIIIETPEGRKIEVKVLSIQSDQIRLGFTADSDVTVDRKEIYERKQENPCYTPRHTPRNTPRNTQRGNR